ncbi:hypothetical protein BH10BAC5_BH10BAC5_17880 [soil metagenome]
MKERIYKYKLDFYYKSLIIYFVAFIMYALVRGTYSGPNFQIIFNDPIIYIFLIFILFFLIALVSYTIRARILIFSDNKIILKNRFGQREILFSDILSVKFSRIRLNQKRNINRVRVARLKLKNRKRVLRIRLNDFNNEKALYNEFLTLSKNIITSN